MTDKELHGYGKNICLPYLHDCLEWLRGKGFTRVDIMKIEGRFALWIVDLEDIDRNLEPDGDTEVEALLKAMIAVKEGEE